MKDFKYFLQRYMKAVKHNLMYELTHAEPENYNRNKAPVSNEVLLFVIEKFQLSDLPRYLQQIKELSPAYSVTSMHDAGVAYCLLESVSNELLRNRNHRDGFGEPSFEFNLARVRCLAKAIPELRELTTNVHGALTQESFAITESSLRERFPIHFEAARRATKRAGARMRGLRKDSRANVVASSGAALSDVVVQAESIDSVWNDVPTIVKHFGLLMHLGIDQIPTDRFFGVA
ncbi:MAG: hypothetical protein R3C03_13035 [Pirellulaceae bacterium]